MRLAFPVKIPPYSFKHFSTRLVALGYWGQAYSCSFSMCASSCALLPEPSAGRRSPANGIGALIPTASPPEKALRCVFSRYTIVPFIQQNMNLMAQVNTYVQMRVVSLSFFTLIYLLEALPHKNTHREHLGLTNAMSLAIYFG